MRVASAIVLAATLSTPVMAASDWAKVDQILGRSGAALPGDVHRYGFPRTDLTVTLDGVTIKPALALGGWVAFKPAHDGAMVMGDLVLTEDELGPVMRKLEERGIEVSGIHNHLTGESPHVIYLHIASHGDAVTMARAIHDAVALTKTPGPEAGSLPATSEPLGIDQKAIEDVLGRSEKINGGILQFGVPRSEDITDDGVSVPPTMGVATAINFQPTGGNKAAITGDFVLLAKEVNPVIKALCDHGIRATALHSHMLKEEPRLLFMHFWAVDDAEKLAKGLRAALDVTNVKK